MIQVKPIRSISTESGRIKGSNDGLKVSDIFSPITILLKSCGSYSATKGSKCTGHFMYCLVIQVLVFGISARYLTVFRDDTGQLYKTVGLLAYLYYYITVIVFSIACFHSNSKYMLVFYSSLDDYGYKYGTSFDISKMRTKYKRIVIVLSTIFIAFQIGSIPLIAINLRGTKLLLKSNFTPFEEEEGIMLTIAIIVLGICGVIINFIFSFNYMFLHVSLYILRLEFKEIGKNIQFCIKNNQLYNLETCRMQHQSIVKLVATGNAMFRHIAGVSYGYGIPIVCLMLYGVTTNSLDTADIIAMSTVITLAVIGMFAITFTGAHLNDAAHESLNDLFSLEVSNESQTTVSQIQLFVTRLKGPPVGVNVYGLFVIDHSTILMVFGTIISYAVIVIQFTIAPSCGTVSVNTTNG